MYKAAAYASVPRKQSPLHTTVVHTVACFNPVARVFAKMFTCEDDGSFLKLLRTSLGSHRCGAVGGAKQSA
jgi:hypothetical protein